MSAWSLGLEASAVIAMRMMKMAGGGPAAAAEARRAVTEKVASGLTLPGKLLSARSAHSAATKTLAHYRRKVRANRRRLAKTK